MEEVAGSNPVGPTGPSMRSRGFLRMKQDIWRSRAVRIGVFCLLSLSLISWDKVSKELAKTHLRDQPMRSYLDDTIRLLYVENTGAAMSFADNLDPQIHKIGHVPVKDQPVQDIPHAPRKDQAEPNHPGRPDLFYMQDHIRK